MKSYLTILFFLIGFSGQLVFSQRGQLPPHRLILKVSANPIILCFLKRNLCELGYETRITEKWSYGGRVGFIYQSPFRIKTNNEWGYIIGQQFRRYKPEKNWFLGTNLDYHKVKTEALYIFTYSGPEYLKLTESYETGGSLHIISGFQKRLGSSRFVLDCCAGLGCAVISTKFSGLSSTELDQLSAEKYWKPNPRFLPSIHIGVNIGFISL